MLVHNVGIADDFYNQFKV